MQNLIQNAIPKFTMLFNPLALATLSVPAVVISPTVEIEAVAYILVTLFIIDLVTGLFASYSEWRKITPKGKWFFRANDEALPEEEKGFSSSRFRKCLVKGIVYGLFPLVVLAFQKVFLIKSFKFQSISDSEINITVFCLLIFCANELFSIFWENLPRCGLNLPKGIRNFVTGVKEIKED